MLAEIRAGQTQLSDGTIAPARATRMGGIVVGDGQGHPDHDEQNRAVGQHRSPAQRGHLERPICCGHIVHSVQGFQPRA